MIVNEQTGGMLALGVDVGTTNIKVVVTDIAADAVRDVAGASAPTPNNAAALLATVGRLMAEVVGRSPRQPDCVGVASMAETGVPLDDKGDPIGDLVRWDGGSADREVVARWLAASLGRRELFRATGVRPSAKVPMALWAYLREYDPGRWAALRRWAGAADLVVLGLTGRLVTDHTLAGRTMAHRLAAPDLAPVDRFDADLLAVVGLRPEQLPEVANPTEIAGTVRSAGAVLSTGLRSGTPVVVAGHDHAVGAWASGVRDTDDVADSLGTAEAVIRVLGTRPDLDAVGQAGMSLVRTIDGWREALVAGSAGAGAMLRWWADRYTGGTDLVTLFVEVARRPSQPTGVVVLPYITGRQTPDPDPDAQVRILGRIEHHDEVGLARALLEGLSFQARWMLTEQARLAGAADHDHATGDDELVVLGGAALRGSAWLNVKAAVGPARLRCVQHPEPVAAGAALVAALRSGLLGDTIPTLTTTPVAGGPVPAYEVYYQDFVRAAREDTSAHTAREDEAVPAAAEGKS